MSINEYIIQISCVLDLYLEYSGCLFLIKSIKWSHFIEIILLISIIRASIHVGTEALIILFNKRIFVDLKS